jgi:5-formyltetrahydrofolate cyclo-ligase
MTKDEIRFSVSTRLALAGAARFPSRADHVPNFAGVDRAARLLCELPTWKRAQVVKLTLDAPQLALRRAALEAGKVLYLATPRLRNERCFIEIDPSRLARHVPRLASIRGAAQFGRAVSPAEMRPIDLIVCGSVAVTRQGARIGDGSGYGDLEYALMRAEGCVREYTPILTTVHGLQVLDDRLPMRGHDIPVDFVVTPDQVIAAPSLHPRPRGIIWEILHEDRIAAIPLLRNSRRQPAGKQSPRRI